MEKISFEEFMKVCTDFVETDGKTMDEFLDMQRRLQIKAFIKMEDKAVCLTRVMMDSDKDIEIPSHFFVMALDIAMLFDCLLAYTNVEYQNIKDEDKSYENYDAIYQSGMADYILSFCKNDFDRTYRMADRSLSYGNLLALIQSLQNFDSDGIKDLIKEFNSVKNDLDKESLHDMAKILTYNDEAFGDLVEKINVESMENAFTGK